jgi:hypothetical protein
VSALGASGGVIETAERGSSGPIRAVVPQKICVCSKQVN